MFFSKPVHKRYLDIDIKTGVSLSDTNVTCVPDIAISGNLD